MITRIEQDPSYGLFTIYLEVHDLGLPLMVVTIDDFCKATTTLRMHF